MKNSVFKIETRARWHENANKGVYFGSQLDKSDGFIHLSTLGQVAQTFALYFQGVSDLIIVEIDADFFGENIKWEKSRNGELFPHLYGILEMEAVRKIHEVEYNGDNMRLPKSLGI